MIRYLIVLECFLVAIVISPWFGGAVPDTSPPAQQLAEQHATPTVRAGEQSSRELSSGGTGPAHLSATDRIILAKELLGLHDGGSPSAESKASSDRGAQRLSDIDPVPAVSDSAALTTGEPPARTNESSPGQPTRAAGEARPGLPSGSVAAAQRHLSRLGYSPGAADGVFGERTQRALAEYRRRIGATDGLLSQTLLARLRRDADRAARNSPRGQVAGFLPRDERAPGWMASIAGGFQRLLGHEFDSNKQPGRIREYCLRNQETWIFDEGRHAFTYCGHLTNAH